MLGLGVRQRRAPAPSPPRVPAGGLLLPAFFLEGSTSKADGPFRKRCERSARLGFESLSFRFMQFLEHVCRVAGGPAGNRVSLSGLVVRLHRAP